MEDAPYDPLNLLHVLLDALECARRQHPGAERPSADFWTFPVRSLDRKTLLGRLDFIAQSWNYAAWEAIGGRHDHRSNLYPDHVCRAHDRITWQLMPLIAAKGVPLVAGDDIDAAVRALRAVFTYHDVRHHDTTSLYGAVSARITAVAGHTHTAELAEPPRPNC